MVVKDRKPKPFPADILAAVDRMIAEDPKLEGDVRLYAADLPGHRPARSRGSPPAQELVQYVDGRGYKAFEYFMSKSDNWRRIPIPDQLGQDLARQAERVARGRFGTRVPLAVPLHRRRSPRTKTPSPRGVYGRAVLVIRKVHECRVERLRAEQVTPRLQHDTRNPDRPQPAPLPP